MIAAVGQQSECEELNALGLMADDRVRTDWNGMRTADPQVFAAGDGAFGGSTIVMAVHHSQRTAYYLRAFLDGRVDPLPYRTPCRTREVAITWLRTARREEAVEIIYFGGVRSGTDAAKLIGLGANVLALGTAVSIASGGVIESGAVSFRADRTPADRAEAVANIIKARVAEASMMVRCTGKTNLQNIEPEDLRAVTIATAAASGIPMVGRVLADADHN